jgi:hypothetical protein
MPELLNITNLPSSRVEFIDPRTGLMSREWYRFFLNIFTLVGGGNNQTSLDDLQLAPPPTPATAGGGSGTVTSVDVSGGTTGLTASGGPITSSGTITLGGTLAIGSGGTGATSAGGAPFALKGANTDITSVTLTSGTITTAPTSSNDIVNKSYADSIATNVNFHTACSYATATVLPANTYNNGTSGVGATLTANANGALVVDSYTFVSPGDLNKRVLVKDEAAGANNGVYTVTQVGDASNPYILTRATDYDTSGSGVDQIDQGDMMLVLFGTVNANTSWVQQTPLPITVGTTALVFIEFAAVQTYTAGTGLSLITNQFSITNTGTAGTYGSATQTPVLTTNAQGQVTGVTNTTITPAVGSVTGLGTGVATFLATPSSANLAAAMTDETGTGALVFATSPTLVTPILGVPQSGDFSIGTFTWPTFNQNTTGTASNVTGIVAVANGGTGTATPALVAGTNVSITGTWPNQTINSSNPGGTVTSVAATVPSFLSVSGSPITSSGTLAISYSGTALPIANGGTGETTAAAAFNALSPVTTTGDLIIGNGTNSATRLPIGANNYVLTSNGTTATWAVASGSGATITNDTTTATNVYPTFAAATSGSLATIYTSNAKLLYKPSTGEFTSSVHVSSNGIQVNSKTVSTSYTIATGNSGMSAGPITIASGQTVTISSGSRWVVL